MRGILYFFLLILLNCQSQVAGSKTMPAGKEIPFEDKYHYPFNLTRKEFLIISSQKTMDEVFNLIHKKNVGNRFSPIPAVSENETYLIIKPELKNSNDVSVDSVSIDHDTLYIKISAFDNPDFDRDSRVPPNIFLKLTGHVNFKNVITIY
ncbi:hypothetical protein SD427_15695 [Chryseobacterium sp. JJR-5R]|uniref:hypothetical protein n=1 Tax=Chryseobacterium sp. JJR-5R TaxID=3093923 RepID=UPI002A76378B|nr:hypothetical protein [Chryseobacterium sp. JJR-5R]WPO82198.1 hypothetical protein SD427_15695 [Chryseobacterium sp. JJR-5R]